MPLKEEQVDLSDHKYTKELSRNNCETRLARVAVRWVRRQSAQAAIDAVYRLSTEVSIPPCLSEVGVADTFIP